jgi:hypothetical protein
MTASAGTQEALLGRLAGMESHLSGHPRTKPSIRVGQLDTQAQRAALQIGIGEQRGQLARYGIAWERWQLRPQLAFPAKT